MFHHLFNKYSIQRLSPSFNHILSSLFTSKRINQNLCGQTTFWSGTKSYSTFCPKSSKSGISKPEENNIPVQEKILTDVIKSDLSKIKDGNPKPLINEDEAKFPKKRGRIAKASSNEDEPKFPKKRGRIAKASSNEDEPKLPKKGRKAKALNDDETKSPKTKSRKPKGSESHESQQPIGVLDLEMQTNDKTHKSKTAKNKEGDSKARTKSTKSSEKKKSKSTSKKDKADVDVGLGTPCLSDNLRPKEKSEYIEYLSFIHKRRVVKDRDFLENRKFDVKNRVNIIDNQLIDDTLERLTPSLQKHKGCDIIDLNPGVGIWSSRLHELLQPRTHIMMEPHPQTFLPILKPLLDAPNSKYRLVTENGLNWSHLESILTPEYLPDQVVLEPGDPRIGQPNNTLLVNANIGTFQPRRYLNFTSLASVVIYQFLTAIRTGALFQKYGKVRILLWLNVNDSKFIPKCVAVRRKAALEAMASCEHAEYIVESVDESYCHREKRLDIESVRMVEEKMKKRGIKVPNNRETQILRDMRSGETGIEIKELSPLSLQKEIHDLESRLARGEFKKYEDKLSKDRYGKLYNKNTAEYDQLLNKKQRNRRRVVKTQELFQLADEFENILHLYKRSSLASNSWEAEELRHQAKALTDTLNEKISLISPIDAAELQHMCDNRRIFTQNPPGLFWDRREAEPLLALPGDFYPEKALSLIDIQPANSSYFIDNPSAHDTFLYFTMHMFVVPAQTLKEALESLAPGALEMFIAECPSLTDPLRNGCPDLQLFSARCITSEMLIEMTQAWLRWPFRPPREELLHRLGSEAFYDDPS